MPNVNSLPGNISWGITVAVLYAALGILVPAFSQRLGIESTFWPSSGVALAAVILFGSHVWPAIFAGACAALYWNGHGLVSTVITATGLTLEPVIGLWLIHRAKCFDSDLKTTAGYFGLVFLGAGVAPLAAASLQVVGHVVGDSMPVGQAASMFFKWWMKDAVGVVMVAPLILVWRRFPHEWFTNGKSVGELVIILSLHFLAGQIVFVSWFDDVFGHINRGYWLYLFITWAAVRLGTQGVMLFVWLAAWQGLVGAIGGVGFFGNDIARTQLSNYWFYNIIVATVGMSIATILEERRAAERQLHLAASVFTHAREGITITDANGTIVDVNQTFTQLTGYLREEVIGKNPRMLSSGRQSSEFYKAMWRSLLEKGHWYGEVWNRRKTGEVFAEMLTIGAVRNSLGQVENYVALFTDITLMKQHQDQLEHVAHFDALTNLPNRVLLADRLQQAIVQCERRNKSIAVAFIDLDEFKSINDRFGHGVGDELLIQLSRGMKDALRDGDTLSRIGGDEFVAVLVDLDSPSDWEQVVNRLLTAAAANVSVQGLELQVSASMGVTVYPGDGGDADQLLRHADQAMYLAKQAGRNRYHIFDVEHDSSMRGLHESLERIRLALAQREFILHYQPKVNMRSGAVIGAEALIRWQHPEKGLLAPAAFLSIVEDHPLAVDVGEWVIETALTQLELWRVAGLDLPVSVNIGARQLQQGDFVQRLHAILAKHPQVNPKSLELEVLETSALADMDQVSQVIENCAKIGVKFALDDFGTGYSSLTYLKRLHVSLLKIDQSFVRDMLDDTDDLAILQGVIGLAAAFKRQVIAEGVETVAHGTLLLQLGCELAQGYGIARPMPADQLPDWATAWQPDPAWSELPWLGGDGPTNGNSSI
jgi:diguanylate cyclase (GGDEF)-like protein/PAS domain S-box-containing protein